MTNQARLVTPSLEEVLRSSTHPHLDGNVIPIATAIERVQDLDPVTTFLKLRNNGAGHSQQAAAHSFLFELSERSTTKTEYSVIGVEPWKVMEIGGRDPALQGDPLLHLESEINSIKVVSQYKLEPKILNGGAFGYVSYDCVRYFEPKVDQYEQANVLGLPESVFMFFNSFVIFDQKRGTIKVVSLCPVSDHEEDTRKNYALAKERIESLCNRLDSRHPATQFEDEDPAR